MRKGPNKPNKVLCSFVKDDVRAEKYVSPGVAIANGTWSGYGAGLLDDGDDDANNKPDFTEADVDKIREFMNRIYDYFPSADSDSSNDDDNDDDNNGGE